MLTHYSEARHIRQNIDTSGEQWYATQTRQKTEALRGRDRVVYLYSSSVYFTASFCSTLSFLRVTWASWASCWCKGHSACGPSTKKVMPRLRIWPVSSPCRDTCSSMRRPCSSAKGGRRTVKATRKHHHTASNTLWMWALCLLYYQPFELWNVLC